MFARPDCPLTPIAGLPRPARDRTRDSAVSFCSLLPCMPAHAPNAPGPTMGTPCGGSSWNAPYAARARPVRPASDSAGTNSASPRSCIVPTTVVRLTLPHRSPVPIIVPCTWTAPANMPPACWRRRASIRVPMEAEACPGSSGRQPCDQLRHFLGTRSAGRVAHHHPAYSLVHALRSHLMEVRPGLVRGNPARPAPHFRAGRRQRPSHAPGRQSLATRSP